MGIAKLKFAAKTVTPTRRKRPERRPGRRRYRLRAGHALPRSAPRHRGRLYHNDFRNYGRGTNRTRPHGKCARRADINLRSASEAYRGIESDGVGTRNDATTARGSRPEGSRDFHRRFDPDQHRSRAIRPSMSASRHARLVATRNSGTGRAARSASPTLTGGFETALESNHGFRGASRRGDVPEFPDITCEKRNSS